MFIGYSIFAYIYIYPRCSYITFNTASTASTSCSSRIFYQSIMLHSRICIWYATKRKTKPILIKQSVLIRDHRAIALPPYLHDDEDEPDIDPHKQDPPSLVLAAWHIRTWSYMLNINNCKRERETHFHRLLIGVCIIYIYIYTHIVFIIFSRSTHLYISIYIYTHILINTSLHTYTYIY